MSIQTALTSTVSLSEVTTLIIEYVRTILEWELISRYGQEIFGILILCTITIFRREISCSGDYKEICDDDDDFAPSIARSITSISDDSSASAQCPDYFSRYAVLSEKEADKLLEQTFFLCCPGPYISVLMSMFAHWASSKCVEKEEGHYSSLQVKFWRAVKFTLLRGNDEDYLHEMLERRKPEDVTFFSTDSSDSILASESNDNIDRDQYGVDTSSDPFLMDFVSNCYLNKRVCDESLTCVCEKDPSLLHAC